MINRRGPNQPCWNQTGHEITWIADPIFLKLEYVYINNFWVCSENSIAKVEKSKMADNMAAIFYNQQYLHNQWSQLFDIGV